MTPFSSTGQNTVRTYCIISTTRTHTYSSQWNQHNKDHYHSWTPLSPLNQTTLSAPQSTENPPTQINIYIGTATTTSLTKCLQYPRTQGQNSFFHTGQTGQGTPTHKDSTTTLPVSSMGPQTVATQIHPPNQPNTTTTTNNKNNPPDKNKKNITIVVPYMPTTGENFRKLCKKKGIQVHFKGTNTLRTALGNPKDKDPKNNQTGIIYHYQCPEINCPSVYIGESGRSLGVRVKEHFKATSPIHLHGTTMVHPMDPEQFNIVHKEVNSHSRTIKEAMFIHVQDPTLNRNLGKYQLPHIWDHLLYASPTLQCKPSSHPTTPNPT